MSRHSCTQSHCASCRAIHQESAAALTLQSPDAMACSESMAAVLQLTSFGNSISLYRNWVSLVSLKALLLGDVDENVCNPTMTEKQKVHKWWHPAPAESVACKMSLWMAHRLKTRPSPRSQLIKLRGVCLCSSGLVTRCDVPHADTCAYDNAAAVHSEPPAGACMCLRLGWPHCQACSLHLGILAQWSQCHGRTRLSGHTIGMTLAL